MSLLPALFIGLARAGARNVVWNGKNGAGATVPRGTHTIKIWVYDKAGNNATPYLIIKTVTVM